MWIWWWDVATSWQCIFDLTINYNTFNMNVPTLIRPTFFLSLLLGWTNLLGLVLSRRWTFWIGDIFSQYISCLQMDVAKLNNPSKCYSVDVCHPHLIGSLWCSVLLGPKKMKMKMLSSSNVDKSGLPELAAVCKPRQVAEPLLSILPLGVLDKLSSLVYQTCGHYH